jgi:hypothetical protein
LQHCRNMIKWSLQFVQHSPLVPIVQCCRKTKSQVWSYHCDLATWDISSKAWWRRSSEKHQSIGCNDE